MNGFDRDQASATCAIETPRAFAMDSILEAVTNLAVSQYYGMCWCAPFINLDQEALLVRVAIDGHPSVECDFFSKMKNPDQGSTYGSVSPLRDCALNGRARKPLRRDLIRVLDLWVRELELTGPMGSMESYLHPNLAKEEPSPSLLHDR